jgi:MscS family membrane protein
MSFDFLQQAYFGNTIGVYLRVLVILILALLLKRYLAVILTKFCYKFFKRFTAGYLGRHFISLLAAPMQGLVVTVLFFIAYVQVSASLAHIIVWKSAAWLAGGRLKSPARTYNLVELLNHVFFFLLIFYFVLLLSRILDFLSLVWIEKAKEAGDKTKQQALPLLRDVLKVFLWSFGILTVLGVVFHVNVAALVAGLGVGGIAIAFAAKESLENLMASFMVMIDKPFAIGDWVKIENVEGTIERVGIRSSRIRTFDKSVIILPNRKLIDSNLENFSERGLRRIIFTIGAIYGLPKSSLELIISNIKQFIASTDGTTLDPIVYLDSFGDSAVNIQVIYYMKVSEEVDFTDVKQRVNFGIYEIMNRLGAGFAFPTQVTIQGVDPTAKGDNKQD